MNGSVGDTEYVLVTEYFHPDTASTGQLMTDLATGLQERGLDMTVYTGQPNYHSGANERQPRVSTHDGVLVKRIRAPQVRQSSMLRRAFNWTVFTVWMFVTLLVSRSDGDRELVFVSNPPFLPLAMWLVCRLRGWEYTYVVYDLYPDFAVAAGYVSAGGVIDTLWSRLNQSVFGDAKHVVALGPVMRDRIADSAAPGFDDGKVEIIHNWADESFVTPIPKSENPFSRRHDLQDTFTLVYSGNIGGNHDLDTLVRAAAAFEGEDVTVLVIGEGDHRARVVDLADELGVRGEIVRFLPYQPRERLPYSLTCGDVSVVTVAEGLEGVCVSSKLYTALAAGTPVLVIAQPDDDEAQIIEECEAGIHVPQGDVEGVVEAIETWRVNPDLRDQHGRHARVAFETRFTKTRAIDQYYRLLARE